jgi:uncharacterized protein YdbL (DUF1318 family)
MRHWRALPLLSAATLLAACVTINVYFPAVAAERAADRIIREVWDAPQKPSDPQAEPTPEPQSRAPSTLRWWQSLAVTAIDALITPAQAQSPDIDVSSPAIRRITTAMEQRHQQLRPLYESGAIGLTRNAEIAIRDMAAVPLSQRNEVRRLVAAENADRAALYREIARANGHPEWESEIRDVFARRWVANARPGWYYQNPQGAWQRK